MIVPIDVEGTKRNLYMDSWLYSNLDGNVRNKVTKKDFDYLYVVDGEEGTGKSVFALQQAKILDPTFNVNDIAFTPKQFVEKVTHAEKHKCIVFDEAFTGLSSRTALTDTNQLLVAMMMEMRQRNLFCIIVLPTIFQLDRYVVLHRAKCLFHVHLDKKGERGWWRFYNRTTVKYLYIRGKQLYEYKVKPNRYGVYHDTYTVDETKYRAMKRKALEQKSRTTIKNKYKFQRNIFIEILYKEFDLTQQGIVDLAKKYGINMTQQAIGMILDNKSNAEQKNFVQIDPIQQTVCDD